MVPRTVLELSVFNKRVNVIISGQFYKPTGWLKEKFTSFEPPVIDERMQTVNLVKTITKNDGSQGSNQTYFVLKKGQQPLYPNIVGCRNPDTLAEMMNDWESKIQDHYEVARSRGMHAGLWSPDMTHWEHCTEDCFSKYCQKQNI